MAKSMDAISSFQHIVDSVPDWKLQLVELLAHATLKHEEFVAEYSKLLHRIKHKKEKPASIASIQSDDEQEDHPVMSSELRKSPRPSELVETKSLEVGTGLIYAQARIKRKSRTSIRSHPSVPRNILRKQMVVIYYDSHIQSELDKIVKALGAARNNLRKGKNAYTVAKGCPLAGFSRRYESLDNLSHSTPSRPTPRLSKAQSDTTVLSTTDTTDLAFTNTDKELEVIQSLCETAAHQMLRDGHCKTELTDARDKLDILLALAKSTLQVLEGEKHNTSDEQTQSPRGSSTSASMSVQSTLCEKPSVEAMYGNNKYLAPRITLLDQHKQRSPHTVRSASVVPLATDAIEVDDDEDDDSSIEIDLKLPTYRINRRLAA
ncbi:hypothetical protein LTR05_005012 [Lithohypha guttulata]|uniref:Uncharacterized protein n=1 Tax=Lithohypha guttulata TaxID=1690604 RepID=A0AAN7Y6B3_9EURO|nr:hypothetical protein LTR05_005012 [Lithohypha guttulata]